MNKKLEKTSEQLSTVLYEKSVLNIVFRVHMLAISNLMGATSGNGSLRSLAVCG